MAPIEIIAPTIVRFTFRHLLGNSRACDNIVDVSLDEVGTTRHDAVAGMVDNVGGHWQNSMLPALTPNITYVGGHFLDLDSLGGISGEFSPNTSLPTAGQHSAEGDSPATTYLVHKFCSHNRRQRAGRMYLGGVDEADVNNAGTVGTSSQTRLNTALDNLKSGLADSSSLGAPGTTAWRVVHIDSHDGVPAPGYPLGKPNAWSSSNVDVAKIDVIVGSQRRRQRG